MGVVIDLIILGILAACIIIGYIKGLTGCILKIVSFVLSLVIAFILFKPIANLVVDKTNWDENLEQAIKQIVISQEGEQTSSQQNGEAQSGNKNDGEKENQGMPSVILDYINNAVEEAGNDAKVAIVESTARDVAVTIVNVAVLIALFLISRIVLIFVKLFADILTELPIIKQFDKVGGIIYGLLEALIIIYVILTIVSLISPMIAQTGIIKGIQDSFVGSMLYNNNLLLKIIF